MDNKINKPPGIGTANDAGLTISVRTHGLGSTSSSYDVDIEGAIVPAAKSMMNWLIQGG
jgi:hypothetical protein